MRQEKTGSERFDRKPYKSLLLVVASTLLIAFVILMVNQAAQLVRLGLDIHPTLGRSLLVFFILLSFGIVLMTAILLTRLEKPLVVPDSQDQPGYDLFLRQLGKRLRQNRYLKQNTFLWDEEADRLGQIEAALTVLDQESQRLIRQTAAAVFVTTAVSQNGTLDGLFVLMSALRLVWQLALLYHQRPAIRDLIKLYTNIFGTVLLTRQIDDLDLIADQLEPVMATRRWRRAVCSAGPSRTTPPGSQKACCARSRRPASTRSSKVKTCLAPPWIKSCTERMPPGTKIPATRQRSNRSRPHDQPPPSALRNHCLRELSRHDRKYGQAQSCAAEACGSTLTRSGNICRRLGFTPS